MFQRYAVALAVALSVPGLPALAQPLPGDEARRALYRADRVEILRHPQPDLNEQLVAALLAEAQSRPYYGAIAFAPGPGLVAEPTVLVANHHSPQAARAAALAECDTRRGNSGPACVLLIEFRPAGWQAGALSLSAEATDGFERDYRRARGPRALAISPATGTWGIGLGENAAEEATAACRAENAAADCAVVIQD